MLHLRGGVPLGVDVGDLLQLECSFQGNRMGYPVAKIMHGTPIFQVGRYATGGAIRRFKSSSQKIRQALQSGSIVPS